jgi:single-stranded-DNA-specific exonuclease
MASAEAADEFLLHGKLSLKGRRWVRRPFDERLAAQIAQQLDLPEVVGRLLASRCGNAERAESFLNPSLSQDLPDPSVLLDMDTAVVRLMQAIQRDEGIAVFGDYDVDGATSSALLERFFRAVGVAIRVYIPDRLKEGYGPNAAAMEKLAAERVSVVITVDCGTMAFEALEAAKKAGLDVIIVDHHKAEPRLPAATAVINPNRLDDESGLGNLAAVGLAFLLAVALNRGLRQKGWYSEARPEPNLKNLLDLVALGTVCDVVPLKGLNRTLVAQGLKIMAGRRNLGLTALADVAGIDTAPSTYHAGFIQGPRVNAGGRVGESGLGAHLLATEDPVEAAEIAGQLHALNKERQVIEAEVQAAAIEQIEAALGPDGVPGPVIIAAGEGWHPGVIGIVASRLKERYGRPAFVLAIDGAEAKGSARSINGLDLGAAVIDAVRRGLLVGGGGHPMAAGLTVKTSKINDLSKFFETWFAARMSDELTLRPYEYDGQLSVGGLTPELMDEIEQVGPFGAGNPSPRFVVSGVTLFKADIVGADHVRMIFGQADGQRLKGIAFRSAGEPLGQALLRGVGQRWHLAGRVKKDEWFSPPRVELILEDAASAEV